MKFITLAIIAPAAVAFTPSTSGRAAIRSATVEVSSSRGAGFSTDLNGWEPDEAAFAWGLPGALAPFGDGFDPLGLAKDCSLNEMKRYREAEVTHGRVAMLAVLGFLVAESFHPLFGGEITGPAIRHLDAVREQVPTFFESIVFAIALAETSRALYGWTPPRQMESNIGMGGNYLRDDYYPGDISFDPLGLKPEDAKEFAEMQTKELQNGRLAMLAAMGFIAQELVNGVPILENLN